MCMGVHCVLLYQPPRFLYTTRKFSDDPLLFLRGPCIPQVQVALHLYHEKRQLAAPLVLH